MLVCLHKLVDSRKIRECLRGTPLQIDNLSDGQLADLSVIMVHCCINGPVGVNKKTTFPGGLSGSIKEILSLPGLSNNSWTRTCGPFAAWMKDKYGKYLSDCQQMRLKGDLWPLHTGEVFTTEPGSPSSPRR